MAKKNAAADGDDLLAGGGDDLLGGKPASKKGGKPTTKTAAAPAKRPVTKTAAAKTPAKPVKEAKAPAKATKEAKPAKTNGHAAAADRATRGTGAFFMTADEKADLAKKIGASKKPISTKELAAKFEVETWKVRRAINEVLVPEGKGSVEKVGTALTYTPS